MTGPLAGLRVVELAGQGPGPHAAMVFGDWGAEVVRVVRSDAEGNPVDLAHDATLRNRTVVGANLKAPAGVRAVLELIARADVLIEGFRPGVTERLGLGPDECLHRNPGLVYARMTGWGQRGPRAATAGHDINYLAITGMLDAIGEGDRPAVPLNLVGDFGGGSMYLVGAVLAALLERTRSGRGQVLDVAIVDGVNLISQMFWAYRGIGLWKEERASNMLDGGAPYYGVYECADGRFLAIGALEQPFYDELLAGLGLDRSTLPDRDDPACWAELRALLAAAIRTRCQREWVATFEGTDACVAPVLSMSQAIEEPHHQERRAFADIGGITQPVHASLFARTVPEPPVPPGQTMATLAEVLDHWSALRD